MITLKLNPWQVLCTLPYQADFSKHMQEGVELPSLLNWVPAKVPGSVYGDLQRAGIVEDPYFGTNSLNCEWVANRWWVYRTTVHITSQDVADTLKLSFKGIDYSAQIYLNGKKIGNHEGMYIPFEAIINDFVKPDEENILVCVLEHAPFADPQPGYTSKTRYLKARYNYKWDFATRLVHLGLYDEVTITRHSAASISHSFVRPIPLDNSNDFDMSVELELHGYRDCDVTVQVDLNDINGTVMTQSYPLHVTDGFNRFNCTMRIVAPRLWYPNGYGEQALYGVSVTIRHNDNVTDTRQHRIGFRKLEYIHADGREDALPYSVVINGKRVYLKGSNLVPICCMYGEVTFEQVNSVLKAAHDCNINLLRIWGGGHIESEQFYDLCDQYGIMVWQEFTMSSSGCDDVPSKNDEFVTLLHKAAVHNIKLKRNHVSLTFWCGGNELTDERYLGREDHEGHPATFEDKTLAMLRGLTQSLSPDVMMLPSSASGPNALLKVGDIGNNHDVHGPWGYAGIENHYTMYNESDSIVHGEFGCGGMTNMSAIERTIPKVEQHLQTSSESRVWAHHSGGWDVYNGRERLMFGELRNIPLEEYVKVSQFVQAEALRYALEANRRRQWKNVGEMTWQFNEPWPNIQCSNIIDYYGGKKLAFDFMRDAYSNVMTSLKYHKLFYKAGDYFNSEVYIINDHADSEYHIECVITATGSNDVLFSARYDGVASEDVSICVGEQSFTVPDISGGFIVTLTTDCGGKHSEKRYLMLIADKEIPLQETAEALLQQKVFKNRAYVNPIDGLRADYRTVLDYVNSYQR